MGIHQSITKLRRRFFRKKDTEIYPDEIFLDASNLPQFDTHQFEGRIEKPISKRTVVLLGFVFFAIGIVFIGKLWILQVRDASFYTSLSAQNRLQHSFLFAERGVIFDRKGRELVWNVFSDTDDFSKRQYDSFSGLAHVLGYVQYPLKDTSGNYYQEEIVGKAGAERAFSELIDGSNGLKIVETDVLGKIQSESVLQLPQDGKNLVLSIDKEVQHALFGFIQSIAERVHFQGGAGVLMDVSTGEILALASFPEYDPQALVDGDTRAVASYQQNAYKPFLNRVTSGLYTPGSIVKPFIALGALEEKIIEPDKQILSTGSIAIPNPYFENQESIFTDWKAHGWVDMQDALAVSSNVYFYEVGGGFEDQKGLGIVRIKKYMNEFGFGEKTGIQLTPEEEGTVPNPAWKKETFTDGVWRIGDTYNTAIGQYGFQVTPLQAVRAIAAVANGGKLLVPTLVRGDSVSFETVAVAPEHFVVVREGLRRAVTGGTAQGLYIPQVAIAAKTGTAELGSKKQFVNSWVTGFFPYEEPRYAFVVIMERGPRDNLIGGLFVMRQLLEWMSVNAPEYLQ